MQSASASEELKLRISGFAFGGTRQLRWRRDDATNGDKMQGHEPPLVLLPSYLRIRVC